MKKILAVIPARAGSKGIPNKNIRMMAGKPMVAYAICNAINSKYVTDIVVSTDSPEVAEIAEGYGVSVRHRSAQLSGDAVTLDPVVFDAISTGFECDYVVTLQPTSPTLMPDTLDMAIEHAIENNFDTVISAVNRPHLSWHDEGEKRVPSYERRLNRQFLPSEYFETGAFVISKRSVVTENTRIGVNVDVFEISEEEAVDIDSLLDFGLAEEILKTRNSMGTGLKDKAFSDGSKEARSMFDREGRPYVIAEMGVNFYDTAKIEGITPFDAAKKYIDEAFRAGVDCVKFQSYKASTLASKNSPAYWDTTKEPTMSQYELFKKFDSFDAKEYVALAEYAHCLGLDFTSTPFDYAFADCLEPLVDFYKISSSDLNNLPFVKYIGAKGKPVVLSVGASYMQEVQKAVEALEMAGCPEIVLLHCVLSYPTSLEDANLKVITTLQSAYPSLRVGFSDHVAPDDEMLTLTTAFLCGARVIEKHFTLDKSLKGNDHYHAGTPDDFRRAIDNFKRVNKLLGSAEKTVLFCEEIPRLQARRSLVLTRDMKAGEIITGDDIVAKRPGTGINPGFFEDVVGRRVMRDLQEDDILTWEMISK